MRALFFRLGVDRAVLLTLFARGWGVGAGLLTIGFVTRFLSPELQGFYYTFYSLIALQVFAELGLNFAIVQFSSHEMAHLTWAPDGTVTGDPGAKRRLQSLLSFAVTWFGVAAVLLVAVLGPAGVRFFARASAAAGGTSVAVPWLLLVVFSAANLLVNAFAALLEGCGRVAETVLLRLFQSVAATLGIWAMLGAGGRLYAVAASSSMMTLVGAAWLLLRHRAFYRDLLAHPRTLPGMSWRRELWPFQWRIAVSFTSGYMLTQLFNPLLLSLRGPAEAGRMGLSLQVLSAMNGAAIAWITTKAPTYGQLIAKGQTQALKALFGRGVAQSFAFLVLSMFSVWSMLLYLSTTGSKYAMRVLPLPLFSLLCLAGLGNHFVMAQAAYLRAHKQEPFMWLSIANGFATAALAIPLVSLWGAGGAVIAYTCTALLIGFGGGTFVFLRKRRQWDTQRAEPTAS